MNNQLSLFLTFMKIGVTAFGGGYGILPVLTAELVQKKQWVTEEELLDYFALGQCTPGVIAVNAATFIGVKRGGVLGGVLATLGLIFLPLVIILILAVFISSFSEREWVGNVFSGIRVAVCGLITVSVAGMIEKAAVDIPAVLILLITFAAFVIFKLSPVVIVAAAAITGILIKSVKEKRKGAGK